MQLATMETCILLSQDDTRVVNIQYEGSTR